MVSFFSLYFTLGRTNVTGRMFPNLSWHIIRLDAPNPRRNVRWADLNSTPQASAWPQSFLFKPGETVPSLGGVGLWGCFRREPWGQTPSLAPLLWCSRSRSENGFLHKSSLIEAHSLSHSVWQQPNWPPVNSLLNPIWERESASFREL